MPSGRRGEWMLLATLVVAALALRLYALDRIPAVVFHDECDNLVNVYQILGGRGPGFFGLDWKPQPAASVYLLSVAMRLGMSITALRLPAALFSVAALVPFYVLLRRVVTAPAALLSAWLLATDVWYLHFSRAGWENIETCLPLLAGAVCIGEGTRTGRPLPFVGAGVCAAGGAYGYFGGRAVLPTLLVIGALACLRPRVARRRLLGGLGLMVAVMLALVAPQLRTVVSRWDLFQRRARTVYVLRGHEQAPVAAKLGLLDDSFNRKTEQLFARHIPIGLERTDRYLRIDEGAFVIPTAVLLGIGMLGSLGCLARTWLWWVLFLVPFSMTEVLTAGSLNGARGIIFVPVLYLFVGLSIDALWRLCTRLWRPLIALVIGGILAVSVSSTRQYFTWVGSQRLLEALEPAIPVAEFPEWQEFQLQRVATRRSSYTVDMWKERQRGLRRETARGLGPADRVARALWPNADRCSAVQPSTSPACCGDCDGTGEVGVNEVILMVKVALGEESPAVCAAGDADGNGDLSIDETIMAVNTALVGCPSPPEDRAQR